MELTLKRKAAGAAAGLALVAGAAGAAYAVSGGSSDNRQAFLNDVAGRLHVTPQQLKDAVAGAFDDRLAAHGKGGRPTQAQAHGIKRDPPEHGGRPVLRPPPRPRGPPPLRGPPP